MWAAGISVLTARMETGSHTIRLDLRVVFKRGKFQLPLIEWVVGETVAGICPTRRAFPDGCGAISLSPPQSRAKDFITSSFTGFLFPPSRD